MSNGTESGGGGTWILGLAVGAKVSAGRLNGWQSCSPLIGEIRRPISTWYPKVMSHYSGPYGIRISLTVGISWVAAGMVISLSEPRSLIAKGVEDFV